MCERTLRAHRLDHRRGEFQLGGRCTAPESGALSSEAPQACMRLNPPPHLVVQYNCGVPLGRIQRIQCVDGGPQWHGEHALSQSREVCLGERGVAKVLPELSGDGARILWAQVAIEQALCEAPLIKQGLRMGGYLFWAQCLHNVYTAKAVVEGRLRPHGELEVDKGGLERACELSGAEVLSERCLDPPEPLTRKRALHCAGRRNPRPIRTRIAALRAKSTCSQGKDCDEVLAVTRCAELEPFNADAHTCTEACDRSLVRLFIQRVHRQVDKELSCPEGACIRTNTRAGDSARDHAARLLEDTVGVKPDTFERRGLGNARPRLSFLVISGHAARCGLAVKVGRNVGVPGRQAEREVETLSVCGLPPHHVIRLELCHAVVNSIVLLSEPLASLLSHPSVVPTPHRPHGRCSARLRGQVT
mmetsp:Transcript_20742/g.65411  ORF Transcript_20742/g.65411 Transcript_20742/m.65411 type:complete len:417 (-) Transcript_20742:1547-2797(-)